MSISRFYTTTFTSTRLTWVGESAAHTSQGTFSGHIQQASPELAEQLGEQWRRLFTIWCAKSTDVQEGDRLTVASGDYSGVYTVKQVQKNATGSNQHLELLVLEDPIASS